MVVVLAHAHDRGAAAVAETVAAGLGRHRVVAVRPEILGLCRWSHQVDGTGRVLTTLTLPSGMTLESSRIDCLINRMDYLPVPRFARATVKDKDYAAVEIQALATSWLGALGSKAINPIGTGGWARLNETRRRWSTIASACGLRVLRSVTASAGRLIGPIHHGERVQLSAPWPAGWTGPVPAEVVLDESVATDIGTVLVTGSEATGSLAATLGSPCRALVARLNFAVAECHFSSLPGGPVLTAVNSRPPLTTSVAVEAMCRLIDRITEHNKELV